jgi:hypothetical protein
MITDEPIGRIAPGRPDLKDQGRGFSHIGLPLAIRATARLNSGRSGGPFSANRIGHLDFSPGRCPNGRSSFVVLTRPEKEGLKNGSTKFLSGKGLNDEYFDAARDSSLDSHRLWHSDRRLCLQSVRRNSELCPHGSVHLRSGASRLGIVDVERPSSPATVFETIGSPSSCE